MNPFVLAVVVVLAALLGPAYVIVAAFRAGRTRWGRS